MNSPLLQRFMTEAPTPELGRELALASQTDQTSNNIEGFMYAQAAFTVGTDRTVWEEDPTLAGEAATKAGLRRGLDGASLDEVSNWNKAALDRLAGDEPHFQRERIAAHLVHGRTLGWMALQPSLESDSIAADASMAFANGVRELKAYEAEGNLASPYAIMLARHRTTHEAMFGMMRPRQVAKIALNGLKRIATSEVEKANSPDASDSRLSKRHLMFVGKQAVMALANAPLIATMRFSEHPRIQPLRHKLATKLLG